MFDLWTLFYQAMVLWCIDWEVRGYKWFVTFGNAVTSLLSMVMVMASKIWIICAHHSGWLMCFGGALWLVACLGLKTNGPIEMEMCGETRRMVVMMRYDFMAFNLCTASIRYCRYTVQVCIKITNWGIVISQTNDTPCGPHLCTSWLIKCTW